MAISLSGLKQEGARRVESKRLAREYAEAQKREGQRGFFSKILGGVGGKMLGGALSGALGIASGGLLMPLVMAGSSMAAEKLAHEATRGMGADPSKLTSKSKYGYGKEEAKTLREGLEEQISASDPFAQKGGFGKKLLSSFVTAGAAGKLGGLGKALKGGGTKGLFLGDVKEGAGLLGGAGLGGAWEGAKTGFGEAIGDVTSFGGEEEVATDTIDASKEVFSPVHPEDITQTPDYQGLFFEQEDPMLGPLPQAEGGLIPKYNLGGMVMSQSPTIADYFGMQGKSLGGSNKQSLTEMLGRK